MFWFFIKISKYLMIKFNLIYYKIISTISFVPRNHIMPCGNQLLDRTCTMLAQHPRWPSNWQPRGLTGLALRCLSLCCLVWLCEPSHYFIVIFWSHHHLYVLDMMICQYTLHISVLIQSLFTQPPITLLDITAKLLIQQLCNFHIISIWPQSKKRTTL